MEKEQGRGQSVAVAKLSTDFTGKSFAYVSLALRCSPSGADDSPKRRRTVA